MEHLDEILERLMNKPKDKQITIFDIIDDGDYGKIKGITLFLLRVCLITLLVKLTERWI